MKFELKTTTPEGKKKVVTWSGKDGLDACRRYSDCHQGHIVFAWRNIRHGIFLVDSRALVL